MGALAGYVLASVLRMMDICSHGFAHGAWKYMTASVEGGSAETVDRKACSSAMSWMVAMVVRGLENGSGYCVLYGRVESCCGERKWGCWAVEEGARKSNA
jgi:hypothetical protein